MLEKLNALEAQDNRKEKCISEPSFNEQFDKIITLSSEKGEVEYVKVTPEEIKFEDPVLYIGAFVQGKNTYRHELKDLAESGREVIFANPIRGFDVSEVDSYNDFKERYKLPDVALAKMAAIEEVIRAEEIVKVELIGHSQGGMIAALLSAKYPTLAKNLVMECPAGFTPGTSFVQFFTNFVRQQAENLMRRSNLSELAEADAETSVEVLEKERAQTVLANMDRAAQAFVKEAQNSESDHTMPGTFLWRLFCEIPGISEVDLVPILQDLKNQSKTDETIDTEITLVIANQDRLFPKEVFESQLFPKSDDGAIDDVYEGKDMEMSKLVHNVTFLSSKTAPHTGPGIEPAGLIRQIINS